MLSRDQPLTWALGNTPDLKMNECWHTTLSEYLTYTCVTAASLPFKLVRQHSVTIGPIV